MAATLERALSPWLYRQAAFCGEKGARSGRPPGPAPQGENQKEARPMAKKNLPYDQKYYDPEIECMPRPELEAMQLERLKEMVRYAYDNTVWYKRSFDEAGVSPDDIHTLKDIERFPFIDKKTERDTQHVGSFFGEMCSVPRLIVTS